MAVRHWRGESTTAQRLCTGDGMAEVARVCWRQLWREMGAGKSAGWFKEDGRGSRRALGKEGSPGSRRDGYAAIARAEGVGKMSLARGSGMAAGCGRRARGAQRAERAGCWAGAGRGKRVWEQAVSWVRGAGLRRRGSELGRCWRGESQAAGKREGAGLGLAGTGEASWAVEGVGWVWVFILGWVLFYFFLLSISYFKHHSI